jgi:hypothetical protein
MRTLALLRPFSASMLLARLLLAEVPWWEIGVTMALRVAAVLG